MRQLSRPQRPRPRADISRRRFSAATSGYRGVCYQLPTRPYSCHLAGRTLPRRGTPPVRRPSRSSTPAAACSKNRWCSRDSPRMTSSILRWRACVIGAILSRHRLMNASSCRASSSQIARTWLASPFSRDFATSGTASFVEGGGQRVAEFGQRRLQPLEVGFLAADDCTGSGC